MHISRILKQSEKFVTDNSPLILTVVGVAGAISTAILSAKAGISAGRLIEAEQTRQDEYQDFHHPHEPYDQMDLREKAGLVWKFYIPPALSTCATVSSIIALNHVGTRRAAALAAAYSISDKAFTE